MAVHEYLDDQFSWQAPAGRENRVMSLDKPDVGAAVRWGRPATFLAEFVLDLGNYMSYTDDVLFGWGIVCAQKGGGWGPEKLATIKGQEGDGSHSRDRGHGPDSDTNGIFEDVFVQHLINSRDCQC